MPVEVKQRGVVAFRAAVASEKRQRQAEAEGWAQVRSAAEVAGVEEAPPSGALAADAGREAATAS